MKTVNDIIFDDSKYKTARSYEDLKLLTDAFSEVMKRNTDPLIEKILDRLKASGIRNFGDVSDLELLGSVAIFLTQIPENQINAVNSQRIIRREKQI
jgi:hypothetical protein